MAIVVCKGNDGTMYYYGPFADGTQATRWAASNCKGFEWHWEDLIEVNKEDDNERVTHD